MSVAELLLQAFLFLALARAVYQEWHTGALWQLGLEMTIDVRNGGRDGLLVGDADDGLLSLWREEEFAPIVRDCRVHGLKRSIDECERWVDTYTAQVHQLALAASDPSTAAAVSAGVIDMLSDQLPTWFKCGEFELIDSRRSAAHLLQDFFVSPTLQAHFPGQPWRLEWTLQSSNASDVVFSWRATGGFKNYASTSSLNRVVLKTGQVRMTHMGLSRRILDRPSTPCTCIDTVTRGSPSGPCFLY